MPYYRDLREYLRALETSGKLQRIKREINKDTELHPLVRLQFRGLPEAERKAFLFENITDSRGRKYATPLAICTLAGSTDIYALGMMCEPGGIVDKWSQAQMHPIQPRLVTDGPVHEEVHMGEGLLEHGALDEFPIPISTPGFDIAPYFTSPYWVTKDPETGIRNVGTYRVQVKSPVRCGLMWARSSQHIAIHWNKYRKLNRPMPAAIAIGGPPNIGYVSVAKIGEGEDEFGVAGGIAGEPVELVKCLTVDLEVPAYAEIVIEGELSTSELEPEAPFGEAVGYMGLQEMMPYFNIKCITHRKNPVWQAFLSQFPPSESSKIRQVAWENNLYKYLRFDLNMPVLVVAGHESTGANGLIVIQMDKTDQEKVWQTLEASTKAGLVTKTVVAVDKDIDPRDADAVNFAIFSRMQPHRDTKIVKTTALVALDRSLESPEVYLKRDGRFAQPPEASTMLINATLKWPYPPISLPKKEFMERALTLWREEGLPPLHLKQPWWGYELGFWTDEWQQQADLAVQGKYYETGEKLSRRRKKLD